MLTFIFLFCFVILHLPSFDWCCVGLPEVAADKHFSSRTKFLPFTTFGIFKVLKDPLGF